MAKSYFLPTGPVAMKIDDSAPIEIDFPVKWDEPLGGENFRDFYDAMVKGLTAQFQIPKWILNNEPRPKMNPDETAFIRAICERPGDDMPRLYYADWLEERGQNNDNSAANTLQQQTGR